MANNNVLKISPDKLGEIVNNLVKNKLMMISKAHPPGQPGPPNPDPSSPYLPGKSHHKLAHKGQHYNKYGQKIQDPAFGIDPGGNPIYMKHMEQTPEEHIRNRQMHIRNYGQQAGGSGIYKGIPNQFDKILDPSGTQKVRPTLDQLREGVKYKKGLA